MPTMSFRNSIAAGAAVANVFLGSQYELAPFDGTIEIGMAAGLATFVANTVADSVTCSVFSGPDVLQEPGGVVPPKLNIGSPVYPDDYHWEDEVAQGDRLKVALTNGNAATVIVVTNLRITPA
jgi:hypothetical protein